jgi:hypothetical protein
LGSALDERRLFLYRSSETPSRPEAIRISEEGDLALTQSFFWDPPNLEHNWISLWDVKTGLPLMDRTHMTAGGGDQLEPTDADFDLSGRFLVLFNSESGGPTPISWIEIAPPTGASSWLPDMAEALGGIALDPNGNPAEVSNRFQKLDGSRLILRDAGVIETGAVSSPK